MIRPSFYQKRNLYSPEKGKALRYPAAERMVVIESRPYTMQYGDTFYSIAAKLFGDNRQFYWTIISDINPPRYPDDWQPGDIILLPEVIVQESPISL
jgi:hypothetical protein